jgi:hypothetical protein
MNEPLVYTKRGNEPMSGLKWEHKWQFGPPDASGFPSWVSFNEVWCDKATGEVVKDGGGVYCATGVTAEGVAASFA